MKKRLISLIMAMAMILSILPASVLAADEKGTMDLILPEKKEYKAGETFEVSVRMKADAGLSSFNAAISYDATKLELLTEPAATGSVPADFIDDFQTETLGEITLGAMSTKDTTVATDMTVITAHFKVKEGVVGAANISLPESAAARAMSFNGGAIELTGKLIGASGENVQSGVVSIYAYLDELASCVITAPAKDGTPQMDLSHMGGVKYTGAITWTPAVSGTFAPGTKYTAHVTLTANDGYKFPSNVTAGCTGGTIKKGSVSLTDGGKTLTFDVEFAETEKAAKLGGTVMISGQAMFGYTLTADTSALNYNGEAPGTLGYRWMRDDKGIANATHNTYTTVEADIGHKISVEVWNSNNTGSVTSAAVTIGKALNNTIPSAIDSVTVTAETITILYNGSGYEFACVPKDEEVQEKVWQTDDTFSGLKPNRDYDVYVRVAATNTHEASPKSDKLSVTTELGTADEELQTQLKRAVVVLNREYSGEYTLPVDVQGSLPNGWRVEYSKDNVTFSTSISSIRDVSESGKYYVKFINDDYKPYVADFDVKITPKDITPKDGVSIVKARYNVPIYTGSAVTPTNLVLYWNNRVEDVTLTVGEGRDVTIAYSNNINRPNGTITVTAVEGGNYKGSCKVYFTINPMKITPTVAAIPDVEYDGGLPRKTTLTVKYGEETLVEDKDYTVSYSNNTEVGWATATINPVTALDGTTNYTFDELTRDFKIVRAKFPGETKGAMNVRSREITTNVQYRLPAILGVEGAEYGDVTTEGALIDGTPTLGADGRTLSFNTSAQPDGTVGKIKVVITKGKNYHSDTFVLTVTAKDKEDADVSITDDTVTGAVTYGRTFTATASAAKPGTAAGSWTWESSDPSILEIVSGGDTDTVTVKAVKASDTGATLTATYSSETHEDTATTNAYTVARQPIAVAYIDLKDREYDGTLEVNPADIDTSGMSIGGKFAGDDVSVIVTGGSYDKKNAGSRTAELELELDGTAKGNYYLPVPTYTVENAKITPKPVTIGGAAVQPSKIYDGTTDANITSTSYTVDGAISGDEVNVDSANIKASYESKDVDTNKTVTFSGFSLTGDDAKNYKLTAQPTATADITHRTLTVTGITVADKTYDATTDAQITNITYGNIVSGDQVYAKITASFADANAGANKPVTSDVEYLGGEDAWNYELSRSPLPAAMATIRKAQLVGAPAFGKVTKTGITLREFTDAGGVITAGVRGVNGENVSYQFIWTDQEDTVIEANKSYAWTIKSFNSNYEDLTGSTVLYPVSTSYSEQVKKQSEEFEAKKRGELPEDELDFRDVYEDDYFFDAVQWAAENGITGGVGNDRFGPNLDCSRGQTMTFLWRASGEPEPDSFSTDLTDVAAGSYYYEAVLWAMQEGVTTGAGAGRFAPDATVTRGQFVTFLYRLAGASSDGVHPFADVPAGSYYEKAIAWAFAEGITRGTSGTTFSPDAPCTRAQIITFLYRYFNR